MDKKCYKILKNNYEKIKSLEGDFAKKYLTSSLGIYRVKKINELQFIRDAAFKFLPKYLSLDSAKSELNKNLIIRNNKRPLYQFLCSIPNLMKQYANQFNGDRTSLMKFMIDNCPVEQMDIIAPIFINKVDLELGNR